MRAPATFSTERLFLRAATKDDASAIFDGYAQDPDVSKYLVFHPHQTIDETRSFLRRCERVWSAGEAFPYVITFRETKQVIGMIEMRMEGFMVDLGYVLAQPYWGQGIVTEATKAVVDWAIAQPGLYRVWAVCDIDNPASARVMEKVGMSFEGVLRRFVRHPNVSDTPRDVLCYAVVK